MNNYTVTFYRSNLENYAYNTFAGTPEEAVRLTSKKLFDWYDDMDPSEITEIRVSPGSRVLPTH